MPSRATGLLKTLVKLTMMRRFTTVEPVFAKLRYNKRLSRFTLRGKTTVNGLFKLYAMRHNIKNSHALIMRSKTQHQEATAPSRFLMDHPKLLLNIPATCP
ncbi:MAG: transposase [Burkholderiaceae bacterium]|nr:transposase [Burkholderiaceae bacterium]